MTPFLLLLCFGGLLMCGGILAVALIEWLTERDERRSRLGWHALERVNRTHPHGS